MKLLLIGFMIAFPILLFVTLLYAAKRGWIEGEGDPWP